MPKGFYLKRGIWYKRLHKPHPKTGQWGMWAESTKSTQEECQSAIAYVKKREQELAITFSLRQNHDPAKITMNELFDDLLASIDNEDTRKNYSQVLNAQVRPYFGEMPPPKSM